VLAYVRHLSGYSRAQVTPLVARWMRAMGQPLNPLNRAKVIAVNGVSN